MKLKTINVGNSLVVDISPLRDQPIGDAMLVSTGITDFSVLATWPLKKLGVGRTRFKDLQLLAGKRLEWLKLDGTDVTDISPLRTMPLQVLALENTHVTDLRPLADIPTLNGLTIPAGAKDIEFLRTLPNIQKLDYTGDPQGNMRSAAEFWKAYDAQQAAKK